MSSPSAANGTRGQIRQTPWTLWAPLGETHVGHPYEGELDAYLASHDIPFEVDHPHRV
jgi:hypothetical protein